MHGNFEAVLGRKLSERELAEWAGRIALQPALEPTPQPWPATRVDGTVAAQGLRVGRCRDRLNCTDGFKAGRRNGRSDHALGRQTHS